MVYCAIVSAILVSLQSRVRAHLGSCGLRKWALITLRAGFQSLSQAENTFQLVVIEQQKTASSSSGAEGSWASEVAVWGELWWLVDSRTTWRMRLCGGGQAHRHCSQA